MATGKRKSGRANPLWERIVAVAFGILFVAIMLGIAIIFPNPTPWQHLTFKAVLALAAAGVAVTLPGALDVEWPTSSLIVRAGGPLAVFLLVFFFAPLPTDNATGNITQVVGSGGIGTINSGSGNVQVPK